MLPAPPEACDGWTGQRDFVAAVPSEREPANRWADTHSKTGKWVKAERRKRRRLLPEAPCREQRISADVPSAPILTGDATLPLRWLPPAPPLWTCRTETPCVASCFRPTSVISSCGASSGVDRKMIYSKKNLKNHKMVKLQSEFVIYQKPWSCNT